MLKFRKVVSTAIIQEKQLLLVRKVNTWILPGGKPNAGESDLECLCREVSEELSGTLLKDFKFYNYFYGNAPHKRDSLRVAVYFASLNGPLHSVRAGDSVLEKAWVKYDNGLKLSYITARIIDDLRKENYI